MAAPGTVPRWADTGGAAVTDPPSAKKDIGFIVAEKPPAQYLNWLLFWLYQWILYLSGLSGEFIHWSVGATFAQATPNTNAVEATGNGTGAGVYAVGGVTDAPGIIGASAPGHNGPGVRAIGGTGGTGAGVLATGGSGGGIGVDAQGYGAGYGVHGTGGDTGVGVKGVGGASSGVGVIGEATAGNSNGVEGSGHGTGRGVTGIGGATGAEGVYGTGTDYKAGVCGKGGASNGPGVQGLGGGTYGYGVQGTGAGTGAGVIGTASMATGGIGVLGVASGAWTWAGYFNGPVHMMPAALPSGASSGDLAVYDPGGGAKLYIFSGGSWVVVGTQT